MQPTFSSVEILEKICQTKYHKMQQLGNALGHTTPKTRDIPIIKPSILTATDSLIIAEVKRASPTQGNISAIMNPIDLAQTYLNQGANAISVLCEEDYFKGSLQDLYAIKQHYPNACILRKDFILTKEEIEVSYLFGADMILLIVATFYKNIESFTQIYHEILRYNLTPLIEIHTLEEFNLIKHLDLKHAILGINSRDLKTFKINKMNAIKLRANIPLEIPVIFESGITSVYDAFVAGNAGFQGILCGSFLVQNLDRQAQSNDCIMYSKESGFKENLATKQNHNILETLKTAFYQGSKEQQCFYKISKRFVDKNYNTQKKPLVKICGINNLEFLEHAVKYADLLGFILVNESVRCVNEEFLQQSQAIINRNNLDYTPLRIGVVTKDSLYFGLKMLEKDYIDCLQLHNTPLEFLHNQSNAKYGDLNLVSCNAKTLGYRQDFFPFYPSLHYSLANKSHIANLNTYFALWDKSGGKNESLDCIAFQEFLHNNSLWENNLWLAGGINITNLKEVLELSPMMIDICSGFEITSGIKSIQKMQEFFQVFDLG